MAAAVLGCVLVVARRNHDNQGPVEAFPVPDLIGWGTPVGMGPADPGVRRSPERFATEVMPQFR